MRGCLQPGPGGGRGGGGGPASNQGPGGEGGPTSGVHATRHLHHVVEAGVDVLLGLLENVDKVLGLPGVGRGEEGVGCAVVVGTGRTADAVDVVLRVVGKVKVDDILDVGHIWRGRGRW